MSTLAAVRAEGWVDSPAVRLSEGRRVFVETAVPADGAPVLSAHWPAASGATTAEVTQGAIDVEPPSSTSTLQPVAATPGSGGFVIAVPGGHLVRRLHLDGLKAGDMAISSGDQLSGDRRLVVALPDPRGAGFGLPAFAVPSLPAEGAVPASLGGASFSQGVLRLPDVSATRLLLTLTDGDRPNEFTSVPDVALGNVTAELVPVPTDLTLRDASGATVWNYAGPLAARATADARTTVERSLNAALKAGDPLEVALVMSAATATTVALATTPITGRLVRSVSGTVKTVVAGDPVALDLGAGAPPLAAEQPSDVTAFVTVRYQGERLSETIADRLPDGPLTGFVVGAEAVRRTLPPQALLGLTVSRLGVLGRAPVAATLSGQLLDAASGSPLGPAAVAKVAPGPAGTVWLVLPQPTLVTGPIAIALRAADGRFLWAAGPSAGGQDAVPLARVALADPDPGGRTVWIGGRALTTLDAQASTADAATPPAGAPPRPSTLDPVAFTGPRAPLVDSPLFVTVELSSLTLHYAR